MKNILFILTIALMAFHTKAQVNEANKKFYVSINSGYNFNRTSDFDKVIINQISDSEQIITKIPFSLGKGFNFGIDFGYNFNKYIGVELGLSYLKGKTNFNYRESSESQGGSNGAYILENTYSSKMLQIKPNLVISGGFSKINPYIKLGLIMGSPSFTLAENTNYSTLKRLSVKETDFTGGFTIGYSGCLGIDYAIVNNLKITANFNFVNLTYAPAKSKITIDNYNGTDRLVGTTVNQTEIEYLDSFINDGSPKDPNSPSKSTKSTYNFNSIGFNLGLKYGF
jgi:Outer membrane protein beta-barrel domain